jgi:DNA primase
MFPIWDYRGQVIAFGGRAMEGGNTGNPDAKYINSPEGTLFNKSRILYAWHLATARSGTPRKRYHHRRLYGCHRFARGRFRQHHRNTRNSAHHAACRGTGAHRTQNRFISAFDGDSAGCGPHCAARRSCATHDLSVRVVALPREDDPDTFIRKHGEIGFNNALRAAKLLVALSCGNGGSTASIWGKSPSAWKRIGRAAMLSRKCRNDIEKDDYIAWLAERWGQAEGVTAPTRMQMIQAAVRREVGAAVKRQRTPSTQYPPAVQREGRKQRCRSDTRGQQSVERCSQSRTHFVVFAAG